MLDNNKCILVYGLSDEELEKLKMANLRLIKVTPEMLAMKVKDIVSGLKILNYNVNIQGEKFVIFNNCESKELAMIIRFIRKTISQAILATVTPITNEWTFEYLIAHLLKEKEWIESRQEGR